jgi:hypothetical protein
VWEQFKKLKMRQVGQLELPFEFDEQGRTIEPEEEKKVKLSSFNQRPP